MTDAELSKKLGSYQKQARIWILVGLAGAIGGMTGRTRGNDTQRAKGCGLENIDELAYKLGRTLEVLAHTHMGKLNVIEHFHRLTSQQIISI